MAVYKDQEVKIDEHITTGSEEVINSTFYQDFFGEEWSQKTSNKNSDEKQAEKMEEANPMFRSTSGSFRYMRFKIGSGGGTGNWRSTSLSLMASKSKSKWQVFLSGFGSERAVPTKMDLTDIKTRQLHSQSSPKVCQDVDDVGCREDSGCRRNIRRKKVWWRLVDVLGCGGGYERKTMVVV